MKQVILKASRSITGIVLCLLVALITSSFQDTPFVKAILDNQEMEPLDTGRTRKMTMKDFDRLSVDLEGDIMKGLKEIDFQQIEQQVRSGLSEMDLEKIMRDLEISLKEINTEKILADVRKELQHLNYDEISVKTKAELEKANHEIDKAMAEIKKIDMAKIRAEVEQAKLEVEKNRHEYEKVNMKKVMQEAREGIDKAREELRQLKKMFNEMEADGLINAKQGFKIEFKEKSLYVNGVKQPERVTGKYQKYFKDERFEITIDKE